MAKDIFSKIHLQWHDFLLSLTGMPKEVVLKEKAIGLWSVKDIMGHISSWEEIYIEACEEFLNNEVPQVFSIDWDTEGDAVNAELWEEKKDLRLKDIWQELGDQHRKLVHALESTSVLEDPSMHQLADEITWKHYIHHAKKIRGYRKQSHPREGLAYYCFKNDKLPQLNNPNDWNHLENSQEFIQGALSPQAVETMANRIFRNYRGLLVVLVLDLNLFQPQELRAEDRIQLEGHTHGWFSYEAVLDVRQMIFHQQRWHFPPC